jgi:adenylate kinase family enzyme
MAPPVRIHIFGASGSGTTTLGRTIGERLNVRFFDSDDYFWQSTEPLFTAQRPRDERSALLLRDVNGAGEWVLSGSMIGWGDALVSEFTLAVYLRIDPELRMQRLLARERERYGARVEVGGDMYEQSQTFIEWARRYDTAGFEQRSHMVHQFWMKSLPCKLLRIEYDAPSNEWADAVLDELDRHYNPRPDTSTRGDSR